MARELVADLCAYDLVGFQTEEHARDFRDCAQRMLGATVDGEWIRLAGRRVRAFADPNPLLDDYRAAVQAVNDAAEPNLYPGSPRFLAQLLRPQDVLILNEKHVQDVMALLLDPNSPVNK